MDIAECLVRHARSQVTRTARQMFFELDIHIDVMRKPQRCRVHESHLAVTNRCRLFRQPYLRQWRQQIRSQSPDVKTRFIHPSNALGQKT